jgi:hypothetical protein
VARIKQLSSALHINAAAHHTARTQVRNSDEFPGISPTVQGKESPHFTRNNFYDYSIQTCRHVELSLP